jgi:hypothetical protein
MAMVGGVGQVSRSVTFGAFTAIVTGGFNVSFFIEVLGCGGLFCEHEKMAIMQHNKKSCCISVW